MRFGIFSNDSAYQDISGERQEFLTNSIVGRSCRAHRDIPVSPVRIIKRVCCHLFLPVITIQPRIKITEYNNTCGYPAKKRKAKTSEKTKMLKNPCLYENINNITSGSQMQALNRLKNSILVTKYPLKIKMTAQRDEAILSRSNLSHRI